MKMVCDAIRSVGFCFAICQSRENVMLSEVEMISALNNKIAKEDEEEAFIETFAEKKISYVEYLDAKGYSEIFMRAIPVAGNLHAYRRNQQDQHEWAQAIVREIIGSWGDDEDVT